MKNAVAILALWVAPVGVEAQEPGEIPYQSFAGLPTANVDLPGHVVAPDGQLTLFADFAHQKPQGVPLYLVNKSKDRVVFTSQDGDIGVKLEAETKSGWQRAQPHRDSWCGNSYGRRPIEPGMHFQIMGYRPQKGVKGIARYAVRTPINLVSNSGEGVFSETDVEVARFDPMSLGSLPLSLCGGFYAERSGHRLTPSTRLAAFAILNAYGEVPAVVREAKKQLDEWTAKADPTDDEKRAIPLMKTLLAQPRAVTLDRAGLLRRCLEAVQHQPGKGAEFGSPEACPELAWRAIGEMAEIEASPYQTALKDAPVPGELWREAMNAALAQIKSASPETRIGMLGLLGVSPLLDEIVKDDALVPLLDGDLWMTGISARALARRGRGERLAEIGMNLPKEKQVEVLGALATRGLDKARLNIYETGLDGYGVFREPPPGSKQHAFWEHVMRTQPVEVAYALRYRFPREQVAGALGGIVHSELSAFWKREAERSDALKEDFVPSGRALHEQSISVDFLSEFERREDIPTLRALLRHRGYENQEGSRGVGSSGKTEPYVQQGFLVRLAAVAALEKRGEQVPDDVVLWRDVTHPDKVVETTSGEWKKRDR